MIDTIVAHFEVGDTPPGDTWEMTTTTRGPNTIRRYFMAAATVRLSTHLHRDGRVRMHVEASLPKLLLGQNITLLNVAQVQEASIALQREVERLAPCVTVPPVANWSLAEVHWCHAWRVNSPGEVINALAETAPQTRAQRTTREDDGHGGQTYRRQPRSGRGEWSEQVYDKGAETMSLLALGKIDLGRCGLSAEQITAMAQGVLRYEVVTRRKSLRSILGAGSTVAGLYNHLDTHGTQFVQDRWNRLSVNWKPTATAEVARHLRANHKASIAADLFNFWHTVSHLGVPEYKHLTAIPPEKWRRQVTRLTEAGLGLGQQVSVERPDIPP